MANLPGALAEAGLALALQNEELRIVRTGEGHSSAVTVPNSYSTGGNTLQTRRTSPITDTTGVPSSLQAAESAYRAIVSETGQDYLDLAFGGAGYGNPFTFFRPGSPPVMQQLSQSYSQITAPSPARTRKPIFGGGDPPPLIVGVPFRSSGGKRTNVGYFGPTYKFLKRSKKRKYRYKKR